MKVRNQELVNEFLHENKGIDAGVHQVVLLDFLRFLAKKIEQNKK